MSSFMHDKIRKQVDIALAKLDSSKIGQEGFEFVKEKIIQLAQGQYSTSDISQEVCDRLLDSIPEGDKTDFEYYFTLLGSLVEGVTRMNLMKECYSQEATGLKYDEYVTNVRHEVLDILGSTWQISFDDF
jgi:hypothetical protein